MHDVVRDPRAIKQVRDDVIRRERNTRLRARLMQDSPGRISFGDDLGGAYPRRDVEDFLAAADGIEVLGLHARLIARAFRPRECQLSPGVESEAVANLEEARGWQVRRWRDIEKDWWSPIGAGERVAYHDAALLLLRRQDDKR